MMMMMMTMMMVMMMMMMKREDLGQEQLQFYNSIKPQASTTSLDKVGLELQGLELGAQICFQRRLGSGGAGSIDDDVVF